MRVHTFGVSRAFAKEVTLLLLALVAMAAAVVMVILSISSRHWLTVTSDKAPFPGMPWMVFELGLSGGIATMYQEMWNHQSRSSVGFNYHSTDKYCPNDACHALYVAGTVALTFLSLAVVSGFLACMLLVVVTLQLSHLLAEKGPFGPYVNYQRCWKNCVAATVTSALGAALAATAVAAWSGVMFESTKDSIPDFGKPGAIRWRLGWVWILNLLAPML